MGHYACVATLLPFIVLFVIVASGSWVYSDANERRERGTPVVVTIGPVHVDTPTTWLVACVVAWIVFFPLYLTARGGVR
jgi:hypothetical protein